MLSQHMDLSPIRAIPIIDVATRLGIPVRSKKALCFDDHDKKTQSLSFRPSQNDWKCFGCGKGGDAIALVQEVLGCDFKSALDWFASEFSVDVRTERRYGRTIRVRGNGASPIKPKTPVVAKKDKSDFVADPEIYAWLMAKCGVVSDPKGLEYLRDHGIPEEVAVRFGVREMRGPARAFAALVKQWGSDRVFRSGLAWGQGGNPVQLLWSSYSLLLPFYVNGILSYIQVRPFGGRQKYMSLCGIPKPLYNIDRLTSLSPGKAVHLCEGVPDTIALEAQGLAAVGVTGAGSFRPEWVELFLPYDVVIVPDGDKGGQAFKRMVPV